MDENTTNPNTQPQADEASVSPTCSNIRLFSIVIGQEDPPFLGKMRASILFAQKTIAEVRQWRRDHGYEQVKQLPEKWEKALSMNTGGHSPSQWNESFEVVPLDLPLTEEEWDFINS